MIGFYWFLHKYVLAPSLRDSVPNFVGFLYPTLKRGANKHCAYGAGASIRRKAYPMLKRGANKLCASGAILRTLKFHIRVLIQFLLKHSCEITNSRRCKREAGWRRMAPLRGYDLVRLKAAPERIRRKILAAR
jgi:hypothetical protein